MTSSLTSRKRCVVHHCSTLHPSDDVSRPPKAFISFDSHVDPGARTRNTLFLIALHSRPDLYSGSRVVSCTLSAVARRSVYYPRQDRTGHLSPATLCTPPISPLSSGIEFIIIVNCVGFIDQRRDDFLRNAEPTLE